MVFNIETNSGLCEKARKLGREFVVQAKGKVRERSNKNLKIPTGEIEIDVIELNILNRSEIPPFTIEEETDGGEELRMKYRYLDLRRTSVKNNIILRHRFAQEVRKYMDSIGFVEVETPVLIKSTPEGARDFVVPSRMQPGTFYALPQSPQTLKQLLMVAGFDKYFQIVKCFRDEDLRADRQPEFSQIDCEMSFVERDDILNTFEGLAKYLFKQIKGVEFSESFLKLSYNEAVEYYGSDKPDLRFDMKFTNLTQLVKGHDFAVFDSSEYASRRSPFMSLIFPRYDNPHSCPAPASFTGDLPACTLSMMPSPISSTPRQMRTLHPLVNFPSLMRAPTIIFPGSVRKIAATSALPSSVTISSCGKSAFSLATTSSNRS